jgi:hypothetical protein
MGGNCCSYQLCSPVSESWEPHGIQAVASLAFLFIKILPLLDLFQEIEKRDRIEIF